jgi:N6-L-threonylcarbamoyladenine synthase
MEILYPPQALCTDNAAMIGAAGFYQYKTGIFAHLDHNAVPNLKL